MLSVTRLHVTRTTPLAIRHASAAAFRALPARRPARPLRAAVAAPLTVAAAAPTTPVTFKIEYRADFGQVLKVVGSGPALGEWNPKDAPAMEWSDGDVWVTTLDLPAGAAEFKLVVASAAAAVWEGGPNRTLEVPSPSRDASAGYILACDWGNAAAAALEPAGPDAVPTEDEGEAEVPPEDAQGAVVGADDEDEGRAPAAPAAVAEVGKMTVEGTPGGVNAAEAEAASEEVVEIGDSHVSARNNLVDSGIGAEEGSSAAAAMTPESARALASSDEDDLESPLKKAFGGFLRGLGFSSGDDDAGPSGGGGSGGKPGTAGATPLAAALVAVGAAAALYGGGSGLAAAGPPPRAFFRGPRC